MDVNADYLRLLLLKKDSFKLQGFKNCVNDVRDQPLSQADETKVIRQDIIPTINAYINGTKGKRGVGLVILRRVLSQCPVDVFTEYALSWMQHCCKWNGETVNEELKILRILIAKSSSHPDTKKQVISSFLPQFVDRLANHRSNECAKTVRLKLKCLKSIIDSYSSSCGPHSGLNFLCGVQWSSKRHQGIGLKESWASQLNDLISTCHTLFDSIYNCIDSMTQPRETTGTPVLDLSEILSGAPEDPVSRFHCWKVKFAILGEILQCMFRTLKSYSQTTDVLCLNAILPEIHVLTFDILRTLIQTAKRNLISYGSLICKLCLQSLKWTQPATLEYGAIRPYETLRCKVYTVLSEWLSIAGSSSSLEIFADEIIPLTISNIEFLKPEIYLTVSTNTSTKGKKKKQERSFSQNVDSSLIVDKTANKNTCVAAHLMLQSMIRNTYSLIKWEHHKTLQYTVISLLLPIVGLNAPTHYPIPYSNPKCRLELYTTLYALTKWPHWKWKKLVSLSNRIFNCGRNDDFEISSFCARALSELEVLTHPHGPSLSKSFLDSERDENVSQKSTLTFSPVSTLKSVVDSATVNTLSIHEPVAKTEASVVTNAISPPDLKDSSSNVIDSNSSSECGHVKVDERRSGVVHPALYPPP
ncbi:hypothetical protein ACFE04_021526 [Oxalis oulophora]